ncbi:MAG TPA: Na+/H+ antiporter NhaC family protein [Candidatus Sulfomarinibacteraceae bacterium]|nr:Na+/H+ antiporter NhaC family protein [Candidatus Sulfomarinibacteraceae bacterium]
MPTWLKAVLAGVGAALVVVAAPPAETAAGSWWSLLPPLVAITLALVFRDVLLSLFTGVWLGATLVADGNAAAGFLRVIDTYARNALTDSDKMSIIVFSMLLGGMVGVMSRAGGTHGVVRALEPLATTPRRSQVVTWLMGVAIFFDDYSNTLIVGNTMRPVTDRHRISREKLAYLVDSTAAPVACVALVSTWIGYQVSLVGDALDKVGSHLNPFGVFLASIPFAFYPIFALAITFAVAVTGRDWGPMLAAERRARGGELTAATSQPLADYESTGLEPDDDIPKRWWNAAVPVLLVVGVTLVGLYLTGRASLAAEGMAEPSLSMVIGASDPFTVLLWASQIGLVSAVVLAVGQGLLSIRESLEAMVNGFKSMFMAFVVLTLAWSLGQVCTDLATAAFLKGAVGPHVPPSLLPVAIFLVAAAVSFATGTSWGTMAILTPLAIPLVFHASEADPLTLAATVSAILGGSVFGDHCSPISDPTILSSMASSCDHVDHVRTQLPYALLGAGIAVLVGYLPEAFHGISPWPLLAAGLVVVALWIRFVAKPV